MVNSVNRGRRFPINPLRTITNSPHTVSMMARAFVWVSAFVTSWGFYMLIWTKAQELGLNWWVGQCLSIAGAILSAKVTDFGLISILEYVLFYGIGLPIRAKAQKAGYGEYWRYWCSEPYRHFVLHPLIWVLMVVMGYGMFVADRFAASIASNTIQASAPQRERKDIGSIQASLTKQNNAALAPLKDAISSAEKNIVRLEGGVVAANPALAKLIATGNEWAKSEMEKKKAKASAAEKKRLEKLRSDYTTALTSTTTAQAAQVSRAVEDDAGIASSNAQIATLSGQSAYLFGWRLKQGAFVAYIVLIIMMFARGENLDVNGDGNIDLSDLHAYTNTQPRRMFGFERFFG